MMTAVEVDEYRRNVCRGSDRRSRGLGASRSFDAVMLARRIARSGLASVVSSVRTAGVCRWMFAVSLGFVGSRCTIVVERGILAKSLVMAANMAGHTGLAAGVAVGSASGFLFDGTALQEMPRFLAYSVLFQVLFKALGPVSNRLRVKVHGFAASVAFASAFGVRIVPGLMRGDGITALPVACAVAGLVAAFGILCGRALSLLSSVSDGNIEARLLTDLRRSEIGYMLILLMIVIGGLDSIAVHQVRPGRMLAAAIVLVTAVNWGSAAGAFMGSVTGLGLVMADVSQFPMIAVYSISGLATGLPRGSGVCAPLMLGTMAGATVCLLLGETLGVCTPMSCVYLAAGAGFAYLVRMWFPHGLSYVSAAPANGMPAESQPVQMDSARRRLQSLAGVFELLARTLSEAGEEQKVRFSNGFDILLQEAHRRLCDSCGRHDACWNSRFYASYETFLTLFAEIEMEAAAGVGHARQGWRNDRLPVYLRQHCVNSGRVVSVIAEVLEEKREELLSREQMEGAKGIISSQFRGIAEIVDRLVEEVCSEEEVGSGYGSTCDLRDRTRPVEVGIYCAARSGNTVSGDSRLVHELGNGRTLIVLGDGMGSGERAALESRFATTMLKELVVAGMSQRSAIEVVNSLMLIRRKDESFSTLDIAIVDTARRQAEFTKMGSCPSYIKSGRRVRRISSPSLPIGILPGLDFDTVKCTVCAGDMLLMISDGVLGSGDDMDAVDERIMEYLAATKESCPRGLVNALADEMKTMLNAVWDDDATLIAVKIP